MFKYILPGLLIVNSIGLQNVYEGGKLFYSGYQYFFPDNNTVDVEEFKKLKEAEEANKLEVVHLRDQINQLELTLTPHPTAPTEEE